MNDQPKVQRPRRVAAVSVRGEATGFGHASADYRVLAAVAPGRERARLVALGVAVAAAWFFVFAPAARAEPRRFPIDQQELDRLQAAKPHAAELLERGEALATAGQLAQADVLFQQGLAEDTGSSLLQRRHCEALTAMGRRSEAVASCYRALQAVRSNSNIRATVRSSVSGPVAPTWADVERALDLVHKERERAPGQFTPIAATCDVASSLGDGVMLQHCASELQALDPEAVETRRAMALLSSGCPPWQFWAGWAAIAAAALATLGHAVLRRGGRALRRRAGPSAALVGAMLCAALSALPCPARAADGGPQSGMLSKWPINDEDPEKSIPSQKDLDADPLQAGYFLQDLIYRAEVYSKHGNHETAARLYRALARAVPERAMAFTKMCDEYEAIGDHEKAIASCRAALLREGVLVKDYEHYVRVVLERPGPLTDRQTKALAQVMAHMHQDPAGRAVVDELECEIGVRTANRAQLEECTAKLAAAAPTDPKTISYEWALAMVKGKLDQANLLLDQAKAKGLKPEGIARMKAALSDAEAGRHRSRLFFLGLAGALLLAAVGVVAATAAMRRRAAPLGA
jgi:tetratricopeptide (TPR) repeat protein